ncbi:MAG: S26 family signal peptidase, partial [Legionellales bacterium]|nr:S26 family signal peptidase [Legionellales bacterium]
MFRKRLHQKTILFVLVIALIVGACLWYLQPLIGDVVENLTDSLPEKYFTISYLNKNIEVGSLVAFMDNVKGLEIILVIKKVAGVAGDVVTVKDGHVFVNSSYICKFKDNPIFRVKKLTPIKSHVIGFGKIFVYTPYPL